MEKSSTPYKNSSAKPSSISLSRIETASSSSDSKIEARFQPRVSKKLKRKLKRRRRASKRKRIAVRLEDGDEEWETESQESINESTIKSQGFTPKRSNHELPAHCNLFEEPGTPEKVRDAPPARELLLTGESPVLHSSRRLRHLIVKDNIMVKRDELLPVYLPESTKIREEEKTWQDETDEDDPKLHYEENVKTYPQASKKEGSPHEWRSRNTSLRLRYPTATSDMLWDNFVDKYRDEISSYLASPSARVPAKLTDSQRGLPELPGSESDSTPPGMVCVRRYFDRNLGKWISCGKRRNSEQENRPGTSGRQKTRTRKNSMKKQKQKAPKQRSARRQDTNVYEQFDETDNEFENVGGERMTIRQFRLHQKLKKTTLAPNESSHSDTQ